MATKLTNAQLIIENSTLRQQYEELSARYESLKTQRQAPAHRPAYVAPANPARDAAHAAFVAKCAAAKALAMSGKRSVFVE